MHFVMDDFTFIVSVPEPNALALLAFGGCMTLGFGYRRESCGEAA